MNLFARFRDWFVSSELIRSEPAAGAAGHLSTSVEVILDEADLFEEHSQSTVRLRIGGVATRAFEPSDALLARDEEGPEEITRPVDARELERRQAASGHKRRSLHFLDRYRGPDLIDARLGARG